MNTLCCVAVLSELGLNLRNIKSFFNTQKPLKGRGKIKRVNKFGKSFFLIDESYNANPLSVKSAVENFSNIKKKGKKKYFSFWGYDGIRQEFTYLPQKDLKIYK